MCSCVCMSDEVSPIISHQAHLGVTFCEICRNSPHSHTQAATDRQTRTTTPRLPLTSLSEAGRCRSCHRFLRSMTCACNLRRSVDGTTHCLEKKPSLHRRAWARGHRLSQTCGSTCTESSATKANVPPANPSIILSFSASTLRLVA